MTDRDALARLGALYSGRHRQREALWCFDPRRSPAVTEAYPASFGKVASRRAPSGDDRYLLMSMSKAYTATLVLKAIDEGRFGLDTRITPDLVPGFGALGKQRATLRQLLSTHCGPAVRSRPLPVGPRQGRQPRRQSRRDQRIACGLQARHQMPLYLRLGLRSAGPDPRQYRSEKARLQSHSPRGFVCTVGHGGQQLRVRDRRSSASSSVVY